MNLSRWAKLGVDFPFFMAPMVGLTHRSFRELVREYVPEGLQVLMLGEMLSARRLPSERLDRGGEFSQRAREQGYIVQLLATPEARFLRPAMEKVVALEPWGVDLNMGCPVPHTLAHCWGSRLLEHPDAAASIIRMMREISSLPLSAKVRLPEGGASGEARVVEMLRVLTGAGLDWATLHARAREDRHKGRADWEMIRRVREVVSIPLVANGDLQTAEDAIRMVTEFGVDGAMIGRALSARPWIFWQIAHQLGISSTPAGRPGETPPQTPREESREFFRAASRLIELLVEEAAGDDFVLRRFRFFAQTASPWFVYGHAFWAMSTKAKTVEHLRELLGEYASHAEHPWSGRVAFV